MTTNSFRCFLGPLDLLEGVGGQLLLAQLRRVGLRGRHLARWRSGPGAPWRPPGRSTRGRPRAPRRCRGPPAAIAWACATLGIRCGATRTVPLPLRRLHGDHQGLCEEALHRQVGPARVQHVPVEGGGQRGVAHHRRRAAADRAGRGRRVVEAVALVEGVAAGDDLLGAAVRARPRRSTGRRRRRPARPHRRSASHPEDRLDGAAPESGAGLEVASACRARCRPWWAREAMSVSPKGRAITWSPATAVLRSFSHCLATSLPVPVGGLGDVAAGARDPVALGHELDGGEQVGVDRPRSARARLLCQVHHRPQPAARRRARWRGRRP